MPEMSPELALVQGLYRQYSDEKNADRLFAALSDDVEWRSCGPSDPFRTTGIWRGRDGVAAYFGALTETWTIEEHTPIEFIQQGERIAVRTHVVARSKTTGQCATIEKADFWTVRNGQIASYQEIFDTGTAMHVCPGHGL